MKQSSSLLIGRRLFILTLLASACSRPALAPNTPMAQTSSGASHPLDIEASRVRTNSGLSPLTTSQNLSTAAQDYANVLAQSQEFGHSIGGRSLSHQIKSVGYDFASVAENLARAPKQLSNTELAKDTIQNWLTSPGHRQNLLNYRFRDVGSATAVQGNRVYSVQIYGARL